MLTAYLLIIMIALSLFVLPSFPILAMRYLIKRKNLLISTSIAFLPALAAVYTLNKLISIEIPLLFCAFHGHSELYLSYFREKDSIAF